MNADVALRELLEAAAEAGARRALEAQAGDRARSLISIKDAPVGYRQILDAEHRGEVRVFRIGKSSLIDVAELEAWIRAHGARVKEQPDEIGQLIELNAKRRKEATT